MNIDELLVQNAKLTNEKHERYKLQIEHIYSLPCFKDQLVENVTVINTGLSQPCFHVKCADNEYCAKHLVNDHHISDSNELLANQLISEQGVSAKLIYAENNWLVTEFISGELLLNCPLNEDEKLNVTLFLLAQCHRISYKQSSLTSVKQEIPQLNIKETITELIKCCQFIPSQAKKLLEITTTTLQEINQIITTAGHLQPDVFCHGDANFSNIIETKKIEEISIKGSTSLNSTNINSMSHIMKSTPGISNTHYKLIDFECACIAPAEYDIAMMMAVNEIDLSMLEIVSRFYVKHRLSKQHCYQSLPHFIKTGQTTHNSLDSDLEYNVLSIKLVTRYYYMSLLINALWYFSQYRQSKEKKYKTLAQQQFIVLSKHYTSVEFIIK